MTPLDLPEDDRPRRKRRYDERDEPPLSRGVYILLGILLGWIGIHNFYAGYPIRGFLQIVATFLLAVSRVFADLPVMNAPDNAVIVIVGAWVTSCIIMLLLPLSILRDLVATKRDGQGRWMR